MYKVEVSHAGDYTFKVKSKDSAFIIDTQGKGVTPPDTLLASLGSCIGVYIRKYAERSRIDLKNFKVIVEADFCKEPPVYFKAINVVIDLEGAILDERRKRSLLEFIKNCPVHNTLKSAPQIEVKVR